VHVSALSSARQGLDDVSRRSGLRVPSAEIDELFALKRGDSGHGAEQGTEVLLGKAAEARRLTGHRRRLVAFFCPEQRGR
jgi:hypothetical protein